MGFNPFLKVVWPVFGHKTHLKMGQNHQKTWSFQKVDENGSGKWVKTLFWAQNQLKNGSSSISAIHRDIGLIQMETEKLPSKNILDDDVIRRIR